MSKKKRRSVYEVNKHTFRFRTAQGMVIKSPAKVRRGRLKIVLRLTTADVLHAIKLKGAGDTQNCPGALCTTREKDKFTHLVVGYVDFWPSRVYVASKLNALGLPIECYVYDHDENETIVDIVDSTPNGLQKLLKKVKAAGGHIDFVLKPARDHSKGSHGPAKKPGKFTNRRDALQGHGHEYRYANFIAGAFSTKKKAA